MSVTLACIASDEKYRPWDPARLPGRAVAPVDTPLGPSGEIFLVDDRPGPFYLLPRYGTRLPTPGEIARPNHRANLYALKALGVRHVLEWAPVGAITHNIAVGDLMLLTDLIDLAHGRAKTFFPHSPLGALRQFPVFCPTVRRAAGEVLQAMKIVYHGGATATVTDGPRMATPAEIRFFGHFHVDVITHAFVPEAFLAKELQLCYAGIGYVANYAETGSTHRPFAGRDLFGGQTHRTEADRLAAAGGAMKEILHRIAAALAEGPGDCQCDSTMADNVAEFGLSDDWRTWFA